MGKGKGIATYYRKDKFRHVANIKKTNIQMSKFSSDVLDVVVLYRSQEGNKQEMNQLIKQLENVHIPLLVIGDFNFPYMEEGANSTKQLFTANKYSQLIREPTHIEGNIIDQAYFRDETGLMEITTETQTKYYSDHRGIAVVARSNMGAINC